MKLTQLELEQRIAGITETLRGPGLSNVERALLHQDRKYLRRVLSELAPTSHPQGEKADSAS